MNFSTDNLSALTIPALVAVAAAFAVILFMVGIFARPKIITRLDGQKDWDKSDLVKFLVPLADIFLKRRPGGRDQLQRELNWNRSRLSPEAFLLIPFILAPTGFIVGIIFALAVVNLDFTTALMVGGLGAVIGWFFLRSSHNGKIRGRSARIRDDTIDFMGTFASVAVWSRDISTIFQEMNNQVLEEKNRSQGRLALNMTGRRRRPGPYDTEVYRGLSAMVEKAATGIIRADASMNNPDPIQEFAIHCDDYDMTNFLMQLRQNYLNRSGVDPEQIEKQVKELRALRIDEIKASEASFQLKATVYLVFFNLLILFIVLMAPFVAPYLPQIISGQVGG